MAGLVGTVAAAVGVFAGTNVDDIVMLTVLFLSSRASGEPRRWQIWAGQYAGMATLVVVSAVAALGLSVVPHRWVGALGLVPFGLGVRGLVRAVRRRGEGRQPQPLPIVASGFGSVAGVTVASGADNISAYTPMFRTFGVGASVTTIVVFAAMLAAWCVTGSWLGSHKQVVALVGRYGCWLVPIAYLAIGALIAVKSGLLGRPW